MRMIYREDAPFISASSTSMVVVVVRKQGREERGEHCKSGLFCQHAIDCLDSRPITTDGRTSEAAIV